MRNLGGWIVVRAILVGDVILLVTVGFICLIWVARPGGVVAAAVVWLAAGGLLGLLPFTDPYRAEQRRYRNRPAEHWTGIPSLGSGPLLSPRVSPVTWLGLPVAGSESREVRDYRAQEGAVIDVASEEL